MRQPFSYSLLLERAEIETAQLLKSLTDLRNQDYELSTMRQRTDIYNLDRFHAQRKSIFTQIYYLEADLKRSRGREAILRRQVAEGTLRVLSSVA